MKIGILQTGHAPEALLTRFGDYDAMFHRLLDGHGFVFRTWNVVDGAFPFDTSEADGWLITGSRHGAYDDLPFIAPLESLIRRIHADHVPLIGVCFGHQIIAQALGGRVEKFGGGWSVGRNLYQAGDTEIALNAWHQDQVIDLPPGATTEASSEFCEHAVLSYGDTIWTVQAHPEFDSAFIEGLANSRGKGVVPDPLLDAARATLDKDTDRLAVGAQMARFFLKERVA